MTASSSSPLNSPQFIVGAEPNSNPINWSRPFQVIREDAQGNPSVILTTQPWQKQNQAVIAKGKPGLCPPLLSLPILTIAEITFLGQDPRVPRSR